MRNSIGLILMAMVLTVVVPTYGQNQCSELFDKNESSQLPPKFQTFEGVKYFINQENPAFGKYNLLETDGSSLLCGMTSLANFINLKLSFSNKAMSSLELVDFISKESLAFADEQLMGGNRFFQLQGMFPSDLAAMAEPIFKKMNLNYKVVSKSNLMADQKILESDLAAPLGGIWSLQFVGKSNGEPGSSHFILILNYDKKTNNVVFLDPLEPTMLKTGRIYFPSKTDKMKQMIRLEVDQYGSGMTENIGASDGYIEITGTVGFWPQKPN